MQEIVWTGPDDYMRLGCSWQDKPVCRGGGGGGVAGYCRCRTSVCWREQTGKKPGCSKMEPLELDGAEKARKDGIRGRESQ